MIRATVDLDGRVVLVIGRLDRSRRALARYRAAGAQVVCLEAPAAEAFLADGEDGRGSSPDALAWVEGDEAIRARLATIARARRIMLLRDEPILPTPRGHVTLVGGGPGDAELMTLAGLRALADADVVLHDRLGPSHVIGAYAPGAEIVDVGKTPGHHAVPQAEIERLMLAAASRGQRVVRLKGGDPFVFGRGGEEVVACRAAGVPVTVVSGVTSAIAVPAAAGIPVTQRDVARAFTVISGHTPLGEDELAHLVGLGGTIVVLMGVATLPHLSAGLRRHGMRADMPLAVLEKGFSAEQRAHATTLEGVVALLANERPSSPAIIVIGDVVGSIGPVDADEALGAAHNGSAPDHLLRLVADVSP
ncbi:uroporphyrinogen-III C-methyltransferase [Microbacterium sp. NPDC089189]|uniref:uroporphyrinogen-III C-methyltransferase n=1 Tax=Microbacterium sp. NPDC089189 TaxID=3154972 RepID=UPI0034129164